MSRSGIEKVCEAANKVRETYYSETYRAKFKLGGNLDVWDVTHISIPFSPEKEKALIEVFGIPEADLPEYYVNFEKHLNNELTILKAIHSTSDNEQMASNFAKILFVDKDSGEDRENIYIVTEPMYPITDSEFIKKGTTTTLLDLLQISARFTQTLKLCQDESYREERSVHCLRLGAVDLDTTYLVNKDDRQMLVIGSLLHAAAYDKPLPTIPAYASENVKKGVDPPTFKSDLQSVFSLMWTVLSGNHYTTEPDFETYPRYAPEEMRSYLEKGIKAEGENILKEMHSETYGYIKKIKRGEMENITIEMAPPVARGKSPEDTEDNAEDVREDEANTEADARVGHEASHEPDSGPEPYGADTDTESKPEPVPNSAGEDLYFDSACGWVPKQEQEDEFLASSKATLKHGPDTSPAPSPAPESDGSDEGLVIEETAEVVEITGDNAVPEVNLSVGKPKKSHKGAIIGLVSALVLVTAILAVICCKFADFSAIIQDPDDVPLSAAPSYTDTLPEAPEADKDPVVIKDFYVTPGEVTMEIGETVTLTATDECVWTSSDPTVAVVHEDSVIGVSSGTCTLSAEQVSSGTVIEVQATVLDS